MLAAPLASSEFGSAPAWQEGPSTEFDSAPAWQEGDCSMPRGASSVDASMMAWSSELIVVAHGIRFPNAPRPQRVHRKGTAGRSNVGDNSNSMTAEVTGRSVVAGMFQASVDSLPDG